MRLHVGECRAGGGDSGLSHAREPPRHGRRPSPAAGPGGGRSSLATPPLRRPPPRAVPRACVSLLVPRVKKAGGVRGGKMKNSKKLSGVPPVPFPGTASIAARERFIFATNS